VLTCLPILLAPLALIACVDPFAPEVGELQMATCSNEDSNLEVDISFVDDIRSRILIPNCDSCHNPNSENPTGTKVSGLDMSSYASLRQGGSVSQLRIVIAKRPCESILIKKVMDGPPVGARMPLNGAPYLSVEDIQTMRDWIAEGALEFP
jgi:hypothetical protein